MHSVKWRKVKQEAWVKDKVDVEIDKKGQAEKADETKHNAEVHAANQHLRQQYQDPQRVHQEQVRQGGWGGEGCQGVVRMVMVAMRRHLTN